MRQEYGDIFVAGETMRQKLAEVRRIFVAGPRPPGAARRAYPATTNYSITTTISTNTTK